MRSGLCDTCYSSGVEIVRMFNGKTVCTNCDENTPHDMEDIGDEEEEEDEE